MASQQTMAFPSTPPKELELKEPKPQTFDHLLLHARLDAPTPPKTPEVLSEKALSSETALPTQHDFEASTFSEVPAAVKTAVVDLIKPTEPPVTYSEMFLFVVWSFVLVLKQVWRDISSFNWYRPLLSTDFMTHYFVSFFSEPSCMKANNVPVYTSCTYRSAARDFRPA